MTRRTMSSASGTRQLSDILGATKNMKRVCFVADYVMHYHRDTLQAIDERLGQLGARLILLTADHAAGKTGRAPERTRVVECEYRYPLFELQIRGFTVRHQSGLIGAVRALDPDVVITMCHSGTISEWQMLRLRRELRFKLVAWQCGYEYNPGSTKDWILKGFIPHFDHHLAYHTNAKHYAMKYGARLDQVTVMHNTINEKAIVCLPKQVAREKLIQAHPQLEGKQIVLYVGAVLEEKRLDVVFDALDTLRADNVAFVVVGDGPHLSTIKERYGNRSYLICAGRVVDGVGTYFDAADVFVLPGTGGLAINEAMAHGIAVISGYADGSADDLVVDGQNGFRLKEGTAAEVAMRLRAILEDPEVASGMGRVGQRMIRGELSFDRFIERVSGVLAQMIDSRHVQDAGGPVSIAGVP